MSEKKLVSIIIPCFNEEKNIDRTIEGLLDVSKDHKYDFEIIAVDDGSKDGTWEVVEKLAKKHKDVIGIKQMGNFGQSSAYQAGFDQAKGDYILTVSADLETPLKYIKKVIKYLDEGYDFVNTNRVGRWEANRKVKSNMANRIIKWISGVSIKDTGSGMKGFTRTIIDNLRLYGEMHRFIPAYVSVYGAKMIEFDTEFKDRDYGESYYKGHKRTIKVILDLVTLFFMLYFAKRPFYAMPGRLFGFTGAITTGGGSVVFAYLVIQRILGHSLAGRPLFTISVLMIIVGIQLMLMGMLGELMLRVYFEASGRKTYAIKKIVS